MLFIKFKFFKKMISLLYQFETSNRTYLLVPAKLTKSTKLSDFFLNSYTPVLVTSTGVVLGS